MNKPAPQPAAPAPKIDVVKLQPPQGVKLLADDPIYDGKPPYDGALVKLWFGKLPTDTADRFFAMGRWKRTRRYGPGQHRWVENGFWVEPMAGQRLPHEVKGWMPAPSPAEQMRPYIDAAMAQEARAVEDRKARLPIGRR